jgi:hypothetical protein
MYLLIYWHRVEHFTKSTFAEFFWETAAKLVPRAPEFPKQSSELFDLAVFLFETNYMEQEIEAVEEHFQAWSPLIENHEHSEVSVCLLICVQH